MTKSTNKEAIMSDIETDAPEEDALPNDGNADHGENTEEEVNV